MIRRFAISVPINAAREPAWSMLADLEQSAAWLPGVDSAHILTTEGDITVVELMVSGSPVVLEVIASPPDEARFEQVDRRADALAVVRLGDRESRQRKTSVRAKRALDPRIHTYICIYMHIYILIWE